MSQANEKTDTTADTSTQSIQPTSPPITSSSALQPLDPERASTAASPSDTLIPEPSKQPAPPAADAPHAPDPHTGAVWPTLSASHAISQLRAQLPSILHETQYSEIWGLDLLHGSEFHKALIIQKFLRANANNVDNAATQLKKTLAWRKDLQPLKAVEEVFDPKRFGGLGYVLKLKDVPGSLRQSEAHGGEDVVTFNIYGAVKDPKTTFSDLQGFMRWRVVLMEMGLRELHLEKATEPIPDFGAGRDPYQAIQVHDYLSVSFLRQDPNTKVASKEAIKVFQDYYPETMSRKFFVNVPTVMGWMFSAVRMFISEETARKFTVLSNGKYLAGELGKDVPEAYGGEGSGLERGIGPKMDKGNERV